MAVWLVALICFCFGVLFGFLFCVVLVAGGDDK